MYYTRLDAFKEPTDSIIYVNEAISLGPGEFIKYNCGFMLRGLLPNTYLQVNSLINGVIIANINLSDEVTIDIFNFTNILKLNPGEKLCIFYPVLAFAIPSLFNLKNDPYPS